MFVEINEKKQTLKDSIKEVNSKYSLLNWILGGLLYVLLYRGVYTFPFLISFLSYFVLLPTPPQKTLALEKKAKFFFNVRYQIKENLNKEFSQPKPEKERTVFKEREVKENPIEKNEDLPEKSIINNDFDSFTDGIRLGQKNKPRPIRPNEEYQNVSTNDLGVNLRPKPRIKPRTQNIDGGVSNNNVGNNFPITNKTKKKERIENRVNYHIEKNEAGISISSDITNFKLLFERAIFEHLLWITDYVNSTNLSKVQKKFKYIGSISENVIVLNLKNDRVIFEFEKKIKISSDNNQDYSTDDFKKNLGKYISYLYYDLNIDR